MKKFFITAAVSVISLASFLAVPSLADECRQDECQKEKCSRKVCSEKECVKEDCAKEKCGKQECGKKCREHRMNRRPHCGKSGHGFHRHGDAPHFGEHVADYFGLSKAQIVKAQPIIKEYESSLKPPQIERREDLEKVLTAEQKQEMQTSDHRKNPAELKLTPEQKTKLKELQQARMKEHKDKFDAFKEQLKPILTDEQQAKLKDFNPPMPPLHPRRGPVDMHGPCGPGPCEFGAPVSPRSPKFFCGAIADELNLTKEQRDKLKAIVEKYDKQQKELFERIHKDAEANCEAMKKEIDGVLTAEQKAKLEAKFKDGPKCRKGVPGKPHHHKHAKQLRNEKKHPKQCTQACRCEDKSLCKEAKCTEDCPKIKIIKKDEK